MDELEALFPPGQERKVTTPSGRVLMLNSKVSEHVPMRIGMRCGNLDGCLRLVGKTSGLTREYQLALLHFAQDMFRGITLRKLAVMSGGTRVLDEQGRVAMCILELPALIRQWQPGCYAMGSMPRTEDSFSLVGDQSSFIPSPAQKSVLAHPGLDLFWAVHVDVDEIGGWAEDLPPYFRLLNAYKADRKPTGLYVDGGGKVSAMEVQLALQFGHPVALRAGSGGIADDLANWFDNREAVSPRGAAVLSTWDPEYFAPGAYTMLTTPEEGQRWLHACGFLAA